MTWGPGFEQGPGQAGLNLRRGEHWGRSKPRPEGEQGRQLGVAGGLGMALGVSAIIWTVLRPAYRPGLRKSSPMVPAPLPCTRPRKKRPSILLHTTALENSPGDVLSLCPPFSREVRTHREKQSASRVQLSMLCDLGQTMGLSESSPLQSL